MNKNKENIRQISISRFNPVVTLYIIVKVDVKMRRIMIKKNPTKILNLINCLPAKTLIKKIFDLTQ